MISTQDAFRKFRSRLELKQKEQDDASRRQKEIREVMDDAFDIDHDFLTGSYRRWTKTKPLKDVDIFCVLGAKERHYRDKPPATLLSAVESALAKKYGSDKVSKQRRSCTVEFGVTPVDDRTDYKVMSFDVVPAFAKEDHYEIPDTATSSGWTETIVIRIYNTAFRFYDYSYAAALGVAGFIISLMFVIVFIYLQVRRARENA